MSREEIQKLLGGYATGTLTAEEQRALYEAALTDQELFDSLAREEALRDVLSDPASRAQLLAAIDEKPEKWYQRWWRPMVVMATAAGLIVTLMLYTRGPRPTEMAKVALPKFVPPTVPANTPMLPPPPEVRRAAPRLNDLAIVLPAPKMPAPPPARDAVAPAQGFGVGGSLQAGGPRQQQQVQTFGQLPAPAAPPPSPRSAMFEANTVQLDGTVKDASGATVSGATVEVKSLTTGKKFETTSDAKGEFKAKEPPSDQVEISANKPGFKETKVSQATPPAGSAQPVNLRMDTASVSDAAEVMPQASAAPAMATGTLAGRAGRGGALAPAMKRVSPVLEYQLLQTTPGKKRAEIHAEQTVAAGAELILRVTPTYDGYVRIVDGTRTIANPAVKRGKAAEIALGTFDQAGRVVLQVFFSRESAEAKDQSAPAMTIPFNVQ